MARCEQGYLCAVCGADVERLSESELYLRFVIGELDPELLHASPERHIRCNPLLAQYIDTPEFQPPVIVAGPFGRDELDPEFNQQRTALITRGFHRLLEIESLGGEGTITDYLLPEFRDRWR
jgi:hypothetical protein